MMKKSFFLTLAAGLLASLAFAPSSQAGAIVSTSLGWAGLAPAAESITLDFSAATGPISNLVFVGGAPTPSFTVAGDDITLNFSSAAPAGFLVFKFESSVSDSIPLNEVGNVITLNSLTAAPGGQTPANSTLTANLTFSVVPEPATFALLGIGMTGLLAFRRLFKRTTAS